MQTFSRKVRVLNKAKVWSGIVLALLALLTIVILSLRSIPSPGRGCAYEMALENSLCFSSGEDKKPWWPLAQNLAWIEESDPYDYDYYLRRLSGAGVKLIRVVLVPWDLHEEWDTLGEYNESRFSELESLLDTANELNISVILALDIYGELRNESQDPREMLWGKNPYNAKNSGPLESPAQFFLNSEARELYKKRLDNLVARIGYSEALFAWEFWNEADLTDGFDAEAVCDWHKEMAAHLKSIDSKDRYITTSFADFRNGDCVWRSDDIDLVTVHYYGRDVVDQINFLFEEAATYGKPVLLEEFGWGTTPEADNVDPSGQHLKDAILTTKRAGFASGPMIWWWDSYIERNDLYHIYEEVSSDG